MVEARRVLRCMLAKAEIVLKRLMAEIWSLKVILARAPKEVRRAVKKVSVVLEKTIII